MPSPWEICACGHAMFVHDVEELDVDPRPLCAYGCSCGTSQVRDDSADPPS